MFGLHRDTVRKMLQYSVPPGYRRQSPPRRPKLDPHCGVIDRILEDDRSLPKNQRHTAKRIYERLRAEHGFDGKYTIVKDYVRERRRRTQEMYVPLSHPAGDAQCDFGQAKAVIDGVEQTVYYFVLDLPHSDACFVKAYPAETTEAFCDGHVSAFSFLGGVPRSILYDNTRLAVARILGDDRRKRTRVFSELVSHYLFEDRLGRRNTRPYAARRAILWGRAGVRYPSNGARPPPTPPARARADPATRATPLPAGPALATKTRARPGPNARRARRGRGRRHHHPCRP